MPSSSKGLAAIASRQLGQLALRDTKVQCRKSGELPSTWPLRRSVEFKAAHEASS